MSARVLDGTKIRDEIFGELKVEIAELAAAGIVRGWRRFWWGRIRLRSCM